MEKIVLFYVFMGKIELEQLKLEWLVSPLAYRLYKLIEPLSTTPTFDDMRTVIKESLSVKEANKLLAYLATVEKTTTSLLPTETLTSLRANYNLNLVQTTVSNLATSVIDKDIDEVLSNINQLSTDMVGSKSKTLTKLGKHIDEDIVVLDSFIPTLTKSNVFLEGVSVIGATSGGGKSFFIINQAYHSWLQGNNVVIFSLEMSELQVESRLLSLMTEVLNEDIINSRRSENPVPLSKADQAKLDAARLKLNDPTTANIYVEASEYNAEAIKDTIKYYSKTYAVTLFIIDYLQLITYKEQSWQAKSEYVRELKILSSQLGIVVLCPSQVYIEKAPDGKLTFKTTGTIELFNSSSLGLLLYASPELVDTDYIELHVAKNRFGLTPIVNLKKNLAVSQFIDAGLREEEFI